MSLATNPDDPIVLRLRSVPARHGALWVRSGFRIFVNRPMAFCLLFVVYVSFSLLTLVLWPIGPALLFASVPLASLGFMIATRTALEGGFPLPGVFAAPLRRGRPQLIAQLKLCALYAVALGLTSLAVDGIAGDAIDALQKAAASGATPEQLRPLAMDPQLQIAQLLMLVVISLLSVPFWHAPALVHWGAQGAAKALFSSTLACWRNKGALTVFMLTWTGTFMIFVVVAQLVLLLLGQAQLAGIAIAVAMPLAATVLYASLYFSFADSFERSVPTPETTT